MQYFPTGVNNKNNTNKDSHFIPRPEKGQTTKNNELQKHQQKL
jgi:hypothetical protein